MAPPVTLSNEVIVVMNEDYPAVYVNKGPNSEINNSTAKLPKQILIGFSGHRILKGFVLRGTLKCFLYQQ